MIKIRARKDDDAGVINIRLILFGLIVFSITLSDTLWYFDDGGVHYPLFALIYSDMPKSDKGLGFFIPFVMFIVGW